MQAAIGRFHLKRMVDWTARRQANADLLRSALAGFECGGSIRLPVPDADSGNVHANYKFYAYVEPSGLKPDWNRDRIVAEIVQQGVPCFQESCSEVYLDKGVR